MPKKKKGKKAKTASRASHAKASAATTAKRTKRVAAARPKKNAARKAAGRKALGRATKPAVRKKAASKKPVVRKPTAIAKPAARSKARAKPLAGKTQAIRRRDGAGHLDPKYAAELRARIGRPEVEPVGFVAGSRSRDDLVEELGEEVIETATSGEYEGEDALNREVPEERGGPFVNTTAEEEFAHGTDASNPKGAKREPFPTT